MNRTSALRVVAFVAAIGGSAQCSRAQIPQGCSAIPRLIREAPPGQLRSQAIKDATDVTKAVYVDCFAQELLIPETTDHLTLQQVQKTAKQSSNVQAGSPSTSPGTTSAVSQPFSLLSLASEYGGLTSSSNSGTYTVQTSFDQLPTILVQDHLVNYCRPLDTPKPACVQGSTLEFLHRFSISATFDTSTSTKTVQAMTTGVGQGSTQQVALTPKGSSKPSLSALTGKFVIWNDKADASGPWAKAVAGSTDVTKLAQTLAEKIAAVSDFAPPNYYYAKWQICVRNAFTAASNQDLELVIARYYGRLRDILIDGQTFDCDVDPQGVTNVVENDLGIAKPASPQPEPGIVAALSAVRATLTKYQEGLTTLRDSIQTPVLSFEYDWNRPQNQPSNSAFKLILSKNFLDSSKQNNVWTLTGNFAADIYNSEPASTIPGAGLLRDIQAAFEVDRVLPAVPLLGKTTLGGAYYFQYQSSPAILNVTPSSPITGITFTGLPTTASQVFTQKGDLHLAQVRWALGTGKNLKFPIAFSYSNRTELITKPDWRAQFGITYDFSAFLSGSSSSTK